ncbi:MAG: hypothetical protein NZ828_05940 [Alphaproteobacteria bacterium]|nr:hypothetical protein [Alphaproteobacteria bacterium]
MKKNLINNAPKPPAKEYNNSTSRETLKSTLIGSPPKEGDQKMSDKDNHPIINYEQRSISRNSLVSSILNTTPKKPEQKK